MTGTGRRAAIAFAAAALLCGCGTRRPQVDVAAETAAIDSVVKSNIRWALQKDTSLLYSTVAHDSALFWFSPDSAGTIRGFDASKRLTETVFMNPAFAAVRSDFREMRISISHSGDVAWWSCILDDFNTWQGRPANWENVRWTGVLEKRENGWVIVQMHFSKSEEAMARELDARPRT